MEIVVGFPSVPRTRVSCRLLAVRFQSPCPSQFTLFLFCSPTQQLEGKKASARVLVHTCGDGVETIIPELAHSRPRRASVSTPRFTATFFFSSRRTAYYTFKSSLLAHFLHHSILPLPIPSSPLSSRTNPLKARHSMDPHR